MRTKLFFSALPMAACLIFSACGDKISPSPGELILLAPAETAGCLKSSSTTSSTYSVNFSWNAATDVESYQLVVTDLNKQVSTTYTTTDCAYRAALPVDAAYSWKVIASNTTGKTESAVRKFYLSGPATVHYAPYPPELIYPLNAAVVDAKGAAQFQITLQWSAGDPDNDIESYALYLDDKDATTLLVPSLTTVSCTQNLASGKTYFWKITTKDKVGNSATSAVSSFQLK